MRAFGILVGVLSLLIGATAFAQTIPVDAATRAAYDAAFQETLSKPSDPPTLVRYAELAVKVGNLEGAISALERLLLIDPDQPRVKLELGALYIRLGSHEAARSYVEAVLASPNAAADTKEQARGMLAGIDKDTRRSTFTGDVLFGVRYTSNANSGPIGLVRSAGASVVPTPDVSGTPDWGVIAGGTLRHRYDLGTQDGAAVETDLALYTARQFKISLANVVLADLTTGPRFDLFANAIDGLTARPFLTGRYVTVHDLPSYWAYGSGLEVAKAISPSTYGALTFIGRHREFQDNVDTPTNSRSTGNEIDGVFNLQSEVAPWLTLLYAANISRYTASARSESYWEYGTGIDAVFKFNDPLGLNGLPWSITAGGAVLFGRYDAADPTVDPTTVRSQRDLAASVVAAIPFDERTTLVAQFTYTDRSASISNFAYNAATAMIGVGRRF